MESNIPESPVTRLFFFLGRITNSIPISVFESDSHNLSAPFSRDARSLDPCSNQQYADSRARCRTLVFPSDQEKCFLLTSHFIEPVPYLELVKVGAGKAEKLCSRHEIFCKSRKIQGNS